MGNFSLFKITGQIYFNLKKHNKALGFFKKALKIKYKNPQIHHLTANCFLKLKQTNKAVFHFNIIKKIDPNYYSTYNIHYLIEKISKDENIKK